MANPMPTEGTVIVVESENDQTRWHVRHVGPELVLLVGEAHVNYVAKGRYRVEKLNCVTQVRTIGRWIWEDSITFREV